MNKGHKNNCIISWSFSSEEIKSCSPIKTSMMGIIIHDYWNDKKDSNIKEGL
jgi:hypothetical protein